MVFPTTYFHILDGLKLVSLKVELPQDLLESIKLFIFHNYDLSDELMVCRFSTIFFVSLLPVSCKDVESLPLVQAFDAIFKTKKLEFEPNNALICVWCFERPSKSST